MTGGPTLVELLGPAGSGKSTLAAHLATHPGVRVVSSISAAEGAIRRLLAAGRAAPIVTRTMRPRTDRRQIAWIGRIIGFDSLVRRAGAHERVLVLDQGPLYTLSRLLAARPELAGHVWFTNRIGRWARQLDAAVVLDAADDELVARIRARAKDHVAKSKSDCEAIVSVRSQREELAAVVDVAAAHGLNLLRGRTDIDAVARIAADLMRAVQPDIVVTQGHGRER